jgi:hypothetical protein
VTWGKRPRIEVFQTALDRAARQTVTLETIRRRAPHSQRTNADRSSRFEPSAGKADLSLRLP